MAQNTFTEKDIIRYHRFSGWFQQLPNEPTCIAATFFDGAGQQLWNMSADHAFQFKQQDVVKYISIKIW